MKPSLFYKLAVCLPYFVIGAFLFLTVLALYGSSQKWPLPRLAGIGMRASARRAVRAL
ncbi:MAG TPA: hypothetical protein VJZ92_01380 [Thermodesulfobacteriota bacterium]|nr:hypothetical protein [Thermodesulfobacteriota bacterium]